MKFCYVQRIFIINNSLEHMGPDLTVKYAVADVPWWSKWVCEVSKDLSLLQKFGTLFKTYCIMFLNHFLKKIKKLLQESPISKACLWKVSQSVNFTPVYVLVLVVKRNYDNARFEKLVSDKSVSEFYHLYLELPIHDPCWNGMLNPHPKTPRMFTRLSILSYYVYTLAFSC